jgi:TonB-linked SusC/RagA family outer membrane protein
MKWIATVWIGLLCFVPQVAWAQAAGRITGQVTDASGSPIAGVAVAVANSNRGETTGVDGRFTITDVPAGPHILRASAAGYGEITRPVTVSAGQTANVNIRLTPQVVQLEGLVATGYGTQRKQDVTGAVATVSPQNIEALPVSGATQALAAQVPGVNVITSTGAPGSGAQIKIRGTTAVGAGSTPLYVVDGIPITGSDAGGQIGFINRNPLNDIPPQDIESITVLKDASAAAIYGSRASNGVVLITTKKGRISGSPQVQITGYTGWQEADYSTFPQLADANEFAMFMLRRGRQRAMAGQSQDIDTLQFVNQLKGLNGPGTDWIRAVTRTAPIQEINASVSGGTERIRAYVSGGFFNQQGIVLNTGYQRASLRANVEANLNDRLTLGFNLAPTYSFRNLSIEGGTNRTGGFGQSMVVWPVDYPVDPATDTINHLVRGATTVGVGTANPVEILRNATNDQRALRILGTTFLNFDLLEGLQFHTSVSADWQDSNRNVFSPSSIWNRSGPTIPSGNYRNDGYLSWLNENTLTLDREFGVNRLQVVGGFTAQQENSHGLTTNGTNFPDDDIETLNAANNFTVSGVDRDEWSLASVLGRVNYTLLDRYTVTGTIRTDGSSRFGANRRWGTFPSAAVAWNLSQEPFLVNSTFVQDLKLRASLGYTGNNQIGNYPSLGIVDRNDYVFNGVQTAGRYLRTLQNPDLAWERTREVNFGLDASFFDRRIALTADAYRRKTSNLLLSLDLPTASGFGSVVANQGAIQNQGFEIGLNTSNVNTGSFRWTSNLNLSVNRNKALDLGASDTLLTGASMEGHNTHISIVGQQLAQFFGYKLIGVYTPEDIANACVPNAPVPGCVPIFAGAQPTDPKFADIDGDGVITPTKDFAIIGNPFPDFTWGMTHTLTYGPVDLRFTLDGGVGGQRLNRNLASIENIDGIFNVSEAYVQDMWISPDSIGNGKTPSAGMSSGEGRRRFRDVSDRWVEDASYVWLRNVNLRYQLPPSLLFNARSGSIFVSIQNPMIWSGFNGNPQTQSGQLLSAQGSPNTPNLTPGIDNFTYPIARTFTIGIDLGL